MYEKCAPPMFHITVDVVIFTLHEGRLKVLLIKRPIEPFAGKWSLPGGFMGENEISAEAATRVLRDKAGVSDVFLEQLYTFDTRERDVRGHFPSIAYYALVPAGELVIGEGDRTQEPRLFAVDELPGLAFDHAEILKYALGRLRSKIEYTNAAFSLLPVEFTLTQLQDVYEAVIGREMDKRNFRKKFLSLGMIEATGEKNAGGRHRPAALYRFKSSRLEELPRWF